MGLKKCLFLLFIALGTFSWGCYLWKNEVPNQVLGTEVSNYLDYLVDVMYVDAYLGKSTHAPDKNGFPNPITIYLPEDREDFQYFRLRGFTDDVTMRKLGLHPADRQGLGFAMYDMQLKSRFGPILRSRNYSWKDYFEYGKVFPFVSFEYIARNMTVGDGGNLVIFWISQARQEQYLKIPVVVGDRQDSLNFTEK